MGNRIKGVVVGKNPNTDETDADIFVNAYKEPVRTAPATESPESVPKTFPVAERTERVKEYREKRREQKEEKYEAQTGKKIDDEETSGLRKPYVVGIGNQKSTNAADNADETVQATGSDHGIKFDIGGGEEKKPKEIAFFSEPKRVKKKTQRSIFIFQSAFCASICLIMLLSKLMVPQLYENLQLYLTRLFQW